MQPIFWTGYSQQERHIANHQIQKAISNYGDIVDFHLFSDVSLSLTIEIKEKNIKPLHEELSNMIGINDYKTVISNSEKEQLLYINISFSKGSGNLKIEVPSVPG